MNSIKGGVMGKTQKTAVALDLEKLSMFIEIPSGSSVKYEIDEETGMLMADRFLHTSMSFPANYGFVLNSIGKDGDPLDVLLLSSQPVAPGVGIKGHVIGLLNMRDEEGEDTKILAVPTKKIDPLFGVWEDIKDVPQHLLDRIKHFFDHYKELEPGKMVETGKFEGRKQAEAMVVSAVQAWEKEQLTHKSSGSCHGDCENCEC